MKKIVYLVLFLISIVACEQDSVVQVDIVQINDVYEIQALSGGEVGGLDRVAGLYKDLKAKNPNTLMVLAGDFLSPSLLGVLKQDGERIAGAQMIDVLNHAGLDIAVFGNHEFDIKEYQLLNRLTESEFDWISANVYWENKGKNKAFFKLVEGDTIELSPTKIMEFGTGDNSFRLGFIGAVIDVNDKDYVAYDDFYEKFEEDLEDLRGESDLVLGLTHLSLEHDQELARNFPEIPLFMGGHEHYHMDVKVGDNRITKADANAKTVYVHHLKYNLGSGAYSIDSELVKIDDEIPSDETVAKRIAYWMAIQNASLVDFMENPDEIVYHSEEVLSGTELKIRSEQTNLGELVTESISDFFEDREEEVDIVFVNSGSIRIDDDLQGDLSGVDIFRILPFGGSIMRMEIRGDELQRLFDTSELSKGTGAYLQLYNVEYDTRGKYWMIDGEAIDKNRWYSAGTTEFMLCGYDYSFFTPENPKFRSLAYQNDLGSESDIRMVLIESLNSDY
jgi:2',3'-cyclic-nucleotide 2'-phosphodiesterase (5'-nucleotidase family)